MRLDGNGKSVGKGKSHSYQLEQASAADNRPQKTQEPEPRSLDFAPLSDKIDRLVNAYKAAHANDSEHARKQLFWSKVSAIATAFAFLAAVIAAIIYSSQLKVMEEQWRDLRRNFEIDQRAWFHVTGYTFSEDDYAARVNVALVNSGKSPVTWAFIRAKYQILDASQSPSLEYVSQHSSVTLSIIFPNDKVTEFFVPVGGRVIPHFTADEMARLKSGKSYLATFGQISYRDQFGEHWTRFCKWQTMFPRDVLLSGPISFNSRECLKYNAVGDGQPPQ